jgi:hypothetical protein
MLLHVHAADARFKIASASAFAHLNASTKGVSPCAQSALRQNAMHTAHLDVSSGNVAFVAYERLDNFSILRHD